MKTKKVLTACLALLLMSNVSFAQNTTKRHDSQKRQSNISVNSVKKAASKAAQRSKQKKKYEKVLNHIKTSYDSPTMTGVAGAAGTALVGGFFADILSTTSSLTDAYFLENLLGITCAETIGAELILVYSAALAATAGRKWVCDKINFSGKDRGADCASYSAIAQALAKSDIFSEYRVILTGVNKPVPGKKQATPLHLTTNALKQLAKFLENPHNMVPWDKIGPDRDYRFYFDAPAGHPDLANRNIYAEVDIASKIILVSSSSIQAGKTGKHIIKPKKK